MPRVRTFDFSAAEARRIALAAQGFTDRRPTGAVDARLLRRVIGRVGLLQIDSVNVLARTQYLPLFARLGPYPAHLLDNLAYDRRELFEYWGHEASYLPVALQRLFPLAHGPRHDRRGLERTGARFAGTARTGRTHLPVGGRARPFRREGTRSENSGLARGGAGPTASARSSGCSGRIAIANRKNLSGTTTCPNG